MEKDKGIISIAECRKILGKKFEKCTDEEIMRIRDWLHKMVKIILKKR